jgi:ATP-binding protein involved in chromosome partitioning
MAQDRAVDEAAVRRALDAIPAGGGRGLMQAGMVGGIAVAGGKVTVAIEVDPQASHPGAPGAQALERLRQGVETAVGALPGVTQTSVVLSGKRPAAPAGAAGAHTHGPRGKLSLPGVRHIVAVASGKGGVGKSTTAANLALALAGEGLAVGVMDADIYGPSMQRLLGVSGKPDTTADKRIIAKMAHGLKVMSMGFLVPEDTAMIWRGPMVQGAITQLLRDVDWAPLDFLIVDMPPGTGDAQLTLAQTVPLSGAVIVSTPQDLALIDAARGVSMFKKVEVPVLGVVENMSTFICPNCQHETPIFGHGGARAEATRLGVPFLGEIPLDMAIRETSDAGRPIFIDRPGSPYAEAYRRVALGVIAALSEGGQNRPAPVIRLE